METTFNTSPVLTLADVRAVRYGDDGSTGGNIVAGDNLNLVVRVVNFGKKASDRGLMRLKWEALTDNVSVDNTVASLAAIPAQSQADVSWVATAKVLSTATAGGQARLRVTAYLQDGTSEIRDITLTLIPHVNADFARIIYDATPKAGQYNKVWAEVKNTGPTDATADLKVVISTSEPTVTLNIPEATVGKLAAGQQAKAVLLAYTASNHEALVRGITLKVTVYHGSNIVTQRDLLLKRP
jgi:hypothetical protein